MVSPQPATKHHAAARSLPPPSGMGERMEKEKKKNTLWVEIKTV